MASVERRPGGAYRVRWRTADGREHAKHFERKAAADMFRATVVADLARGTYVDPHDARMTVETYARQWVAAQLYRPSTAQLVERAFRVRINPVLGAYRIGQVRRSHIQSWVKAQSAAYAPSTLRITYSYLVGMFGAAVVDQVIGRDPCAGVRLPDNHHADRVIPSAGQVHALADALPARYAAAVYLAAGAGLRGGEIFGLESDHVQFLRREIAVGQQLVCVAGRAPYLGPPKTRTSVRTAELAATVGDALARQLEQYPATDVEITDDTDPRRSVQRTARLIFTNPNGAPVHRASWSHIWQPAARAAGLSEGSGLHLLRHYYATLLIHSGANVKTVQLALGHASPTITLNIYVGEWPDGTDRTRSAVDTALAKIGNGADQVRTRKINGG